MPESQNRSPKLASPLDRDAVNMVLGRSKLPKIEPEVHLKHEKDNHRDPYVNNKEADSVLAAQPLLEPDLEKQKPPLASIPDVNTYQEKKNLAQGMMHLTLPSDSYFYLRRASITLSIVLQWAGLTLLCIGVNIQLKISTITNVIDGFYEFGPIGSMVVGSMVFLIAFFGCRGAIKESNCMLVTYSIFMIVLIILKMTLATVVFVTSYELVNTVKAEFVKTFITNQNAFREIETSLKCCGPEGLVSYGVNIMQLPPSCCQQGVGLCMYLNAYPDCNSRAVDFISTSTAAIGVMCIVVAAVEVTLL